MARLYRTTPDALQQAGSDCDTTAGEIDGQLKILRTYVEGLRGVWEGMAPGTFQTLMDRFQMDSQNINLALRGIAGTLRYTAMAYVEGEEAANRAVGNVYVEQPGQHSPVTDISGTPVNPNYQVSLG